MAFSSVRLYRFRNLADITLPTNAREVFLVGENGQGKTNFLEAVYFTCYGSSFRTRRDDTLIRHGETELAVESVFAQEGEEQTLLVKQLGRTKKITIDGKEVRDRKDLASTVPCIVFCHDDINFVTGAPEMQRWFMNQTLSLVDPGYLDSLRAYNRVLRERNAALKTDRFELLDVLDLQLAEAGRPVVEKRNAISTRFAEVLATLFHTVFESTTALTLTYRPSWKDDDILSILSSRRDMDIRMTTSTSGPHRDKFIYHLGDTLLTDAGSTGQLRLVSLILRVAQARFVSDATGRLPILLLDDVLLELDPRRRRRFVEELPDYDQAFFTFLPDEQYARFRSDSTLTYRVSDGRLASDEAVSPIGTRDGAEHGSPQEKTTE